MPSLRRYASAVLLLASMALAKSAQGARVLVVHDHGLVTEDYGVFWRSLTGPFPRWPATHSSMS